MFTIFLCAACVVLGYVAHQFITREVTTVESWVEDHTGAAGMKNIVKTIRERV